MAGESATPVLTGTREQVNAYLRRVGARKMRPAADGAEWFRASSGVYLRAAPDGNGTHAVTAHARCGC